DGPRRRDLGDTEPADAQPADGKIVALAAELQRSAAEVAAPDEGDLHLLDADRAGFPEIVGPAGTRDRKRQQQEGRERADPLQPDHAAQAAGDHSVCHQLCSPNRLPPRKRGPRPHSTTDHDDYSIGPWSNAQLPEGATLLRTNDILNFDSIPNLPQ